MPDLAINERPILFQPALVRAILDGRKTVTRRILKHDGLPSVPVTFSVWTETSSAGLWFGWNNEGTTITARCPYGSKGDRLWVRENFALLPRHDMKFHGNRRTPLKPEEQEVVYAADLTHGGAHPRWRPSIFMPRWACRLRLVITGVRVERLQEITGVDVRAEGVEADQRCSDVTLRGMFATGWDRINGKRGALASNPWVWVLTFRKEESRG